MPHRTPLYALHQRANATFEVSFGYELPSRFTTLETEYKAAISRSAMFDISHTGKIRLSGPDVPEFLHRICTNDVKELPLGGGCPIFFCDPRAKVLFSADVYHTTFNNDHCYWMETTPGRAEALFKHLDRYLISEAVELTDVTSQYALIHLAGPSSRQILESALGNPIPDLNEYEQMLRTFGSQSEATIRRRDRLGLPGYDILIPNDRADGIWRMLDAAGGVPAGSQCYEVLRVEAAQPVYGIDMDESRFVMEVGQAAKAVSFSKGCFPGQEPIVMSRDRAGRVNRQFLGLKVTNGTKPLPNGTALIKDGQEVGLITSSVISPRLGSPLALGYVHWKQVEHGNKLTATIDEELIELEVLGPKPIEQA